MEFIAHTPYPARKAVAGIALKSGIHYAVRDSSSGVGLPFRIGGHLLAQVTPYSFVLRFVMNPPLKLTML